MSIDYIDINTLRPHVYNEWTPKHGRTMQALGYGRVSNLNATGVDRGQTKSTAEQRREFERWCKANGYEPRWWFDEGAASGSKNRHKRVTFDDATATIVGGKVDVLWVWSSSRAARDDEVVYNELLPLLKKTNTRYSYGRRVYNVNDPKDRDAIITDALRDAAYAARIGEDVSRAAVERAANGYAHGRPPFGYRRVWVETDEGDMPDNTPYDDYGNLLNDAHTVQAIFAQFLAGVSLVSIVADLEANAPMPTKIARGGKHAGEQIGKGWTRTQVRRILSNPSYAGLRQYNGHVVGPASWPSLVTLADYEAVQATLNAAAKAHTRGNKRTSLLSGVARCGVCNSPLRHGNSRRPNGGRYYVYACPDNARHVAIKALDTDRIVTGVLLTAIAATKDYKTLSPTKSADALRIDDAIAEHLRNIDKWTDEMFAGTKSEATAEKFIDRAHAEVAKLRAQREAMADKAAPWPTTVDDIAAADDPAAAFAAQALEVRVAIIRAMLTVTINTTTAKSGAFDADRIDARPVPR